MRLVGVFVFLSCLCVCLSLIMFLSGSTFVCVYLKSLWSLSFSVGVLSWYWYWYCGASLLAIHNPWDKLAKQKYFFRSQPADLHKSTQISHTDRTRLPHFHFLLFPRYVSAFPLICQKCFLHFPLYLQIYFHKPLSLANPQHMFPLIFLVVLVFFL